MRCLLCCSCRCAVVSQVFLEDGLVSAAVVVEAWSWRLYPRKIEKSGVNRSSTRLDTFMMCWLFRQSETDKRPSEPTIVLC